MQNAASNLFSVAGKTALVTGATSGLGLMMAGGLLDAGADVTIVSRNLEKCARIAGELAPRGAVQAIAADLSTQAGIETVAQEFGDRPLNILVNNAGLVEQKPIGEFTEAMWDRALDLNLKAGFFLIQTLLPNLRQAASAEDPARIVNISSGHGHRVSMFDHFGYTASKAGLNHLTRQLAQKLAGEHITVNAIAPGVFATALTAEFPEEVLQRIAATVPTGRFGDEQDIVGALLYLVSRAGAYVTSTVLAVDGGWAGIA